MGSCRLTQKVIKLGFNLLLEVFEIITCSNVLTACLSGALGREGSFAGFYPKSGTTNKFVVEEAGWEGGWLGDRLGNKEVEAFTSYFCALNSFSNCQIKIDFYSWSWDTN